MFFMFVHISLTMNRNGLTHNSYGESWQAHKRYKRSTFKKLKLICLKKPFDNTSEDTAKTYEAATIRVKKYKSLIECQKHRCFELHMLSFQSSGYGQLYEVCFRRKEIKVYLFNKDYLFSE
jgi:hypothetical protein